MESLVLYLHEMSVAGRETVVSVIGFFNKGKTFVVNKIADLNLPSARQVHTRGLSFILPGDERRQNCIFLDTAGTNSPVWGIVTRDAIVSRGCPRDRYYRYFVLLCF